MDDTQDFAPGHGLGGASDTAPTGLSIPAASDTAASTTTSAPGATQEPTGEAEGSAPDGDGGDGSPRPANKKRRRGSRGGKRRKKPGTGPGPDGSDDGSDDGDDGDDAEGDDDEGDEDDDRTDGGERRDVPRITAPSPRSGTPRAGAARSRRPERVDESDDEAGDDVELPERASEGRASADAAAAALVSRKPRIGDTRPAPSGVAAGAAVTPEVEPRERQGRPRNGGKRPQGAEAGQGGEGGQRGQGTPRGGGQRGGGQGPKARPEPAEGRDQDESPSSSSRKRKRNRGKASASEVASHDAHVQLDAEALERRKGRERKGRPVGRYMMCVHVDHGLTQVAVLEGRSLVEHYVSRPSDDVGHIHGNIYVGRVQNVLPGMEAAFVDIATPKNAVLYAGDVQYDPEDIVERSAEKPRIEQLLKNRQLILCQVTKNPIGAKGARLTQEVSLPGRFVVLIPNSKTYGISKRLPDDERKRLRSVLDRVKEPEHGLIVRTAAEGATEEELRADVMRLNETWRDIERRAEQARKQNRAQLLYREPDLAVRVIREEFNADYRSIVIDDRELFEEVKNYVEVMNPELAERVEFYDAAAEGLPMYERFHIHEQLHKALDRKVWLASGGSLIIEHTEALTVIDVNTGRNVGTSSLEKTVLQNNLEAAAEIARQLRLRDIGGIIVIDFIDMEVKENRRKVVEAFREALARDKTRSQVFDISELGLVEMTRKRIGEGLLQSFAEHCPHCEGRGVVVNHALLS